MADSMSGSGSDPTDDPYYDLTAEERAKLDRIRNGEEE